MKKQIIHFLVACFLLNVLQVDPVWALRPTAIASQYGSRKAIQAALQENSLPAIDTFPAEERAFLETLQQHLTTRPVVSPVPGEEGATIKAGSAILLRFYKGEWQVFLVKRKAEARRYPRFWVFPTETREENGIGVQEKPLEAILRGLEEELHLELTPAHVIGRIGKYLTADKKGIVSPIFFLVSEEESRKIRVDPSENEKGQWIPASLFLNGKIQQEGFLPEGTFGSPAKFGPVSAAVDFSNVFREAGREALQPRIELVGRELFGHLRRDAFLQKIVHPQDAWRDAFVQYGMQNGLRDGTLGFLAEYPALRTPERLEEALERHFPKEELPKAFASALWLLEHTPSGARRGLTEVPIRFVGRRFIAAETSETIIPRLKRLRRQGIVFTLDPVGEAVKDEADAKENLAANLFLFEALDKATKNWRWDDFKDVPYMSHVSIKLSSLITAFDREHKEELKNRVRWLMRQGKTKGVFIRIDMEEYEVKDLTLEIFTELLDEEEFLRYEGLGIVVQAYLKDSPEDVTSLIEFAKRRKEKGGWRTPIRLVKGAYPDQDRLHRWDEKWQTDETYEALSHLLLENVDVILPAFGTHNIRSIASIAAYARFLGVPKEAFEFQFLYGMGEPIQRALVRAGYRVRLYTPFGPLERAIPYLVRRFIENSSQISFLRQSLSGGYDLNELLRRPREFAQAADGAAHQNIERMTTLPLRKGEAFIGITPAVEVQLLDVSGRGRRPIKLRLRIPNTLRLSWLSVHLKRLKEDNWQDTHYPVLPQHRDRPFFAIRDFNPESVLVIDDGAFYLRILEFSSREQIATVEIVRGMRRGPVPDHLTVSRDGADRFGRVEQHLGVVTTLTDQEVDFVRTFVLTVIALLDHLEGMDPTHLLDEPKVLPAGVHFKQPRTIELVGPSDGYLEKVLARLLEFAEGIGIHGGRIRETEKQTRYQLVPNQTLYQVLQGAATGGLSEGTVATSYGWLRESVRVRIDNIADAIFEKDTPRLARSEKALWHPLVTREILADAIRGRIRREKAARLLEAVLGIAYPVTSAYVQNLPDADAKDGSVHRGSEVTRILQAKAHHLIHTGGAYDEVIRVAEELFQHLLKPAYQQSEKTRKRIPDILRDRNYLTVELVKREQFTEARHLLWGSDQLVERFQDVEGVVARKGNSRYPSGERPSLSYTISAHNNFAMGLMNQRFFEEAVEQFRTALRLLQSYGGQGGEPLRREADYVAGVANRLLKIYRHPRHLRNTREEVFSLASELYESFSDVISDENHETFLEVVSQYDLSGHLHGKRSPTAGDGAARVSRPRPFSLHLLDPLFSP